MKKIIFCSTLAFMFCITSMGQNTSEVKAETVKQDKATKEQAELELFQKAGFTDADIKTVKDIITEYDNKSRAIKKDVQLSNDDKKSKGKELSTEKYDKIKKAIGDEKYNNWQKARKESKK